MTMLAIGVLAVVAIYWFFFRKKDTKKESSFNPDYLVIGDEMGYNGESSYTKATCKSPRKWNGDKISYTDANGVTTYTISATSGTCKIPESKYTGDYSGYTNTDSPACKKPRTCCKNGKVVPCDDISKEDKKELAGS